MWTFASTNACDFAQLGVAMESQAATLSQLSPENLASLYYTLAENELSPVESLEILRNVWRVSDPEYPKLNETLLEEVASLLNYRYAEQRAQFLDLFGYFRLLAAEQIELVKSDFVLACAPVGPFLF